MLAKTHMEELRFRSLITIFSLAGTKGESLGEDPGHDGSFLWTQMSLSQGKDKKRPKEMELLVHRIQITLSLSSDQRLARNL